MAETEGRNRTMDTPEQLYDRLRFHMADDQAADIAEKVYRPLLARIEELERRIEGEGRAR